MTTTSITDEMVEAAAAAIGALRRQGPEHYYRDARAALEAALPYLQPAAVRAHERDSEIAGLGGVLYHQDGPDDGHPRTECDLTVCGWQRP